MALRERVASGGSGTGGGYASGSSVATSAAGSERCIVFRAKTACTVVELLVQSTATPDRISLYEVSGTPFATMDATVGAQRASSTSVVSEGSGLYRVTVPATHLTAGACYAVFAQMNGADQFPLGSITPAEIASNSYIEAVYFVASFDGSRRAGAYVVNGADPEPGVTQITNYAFIDAYLGINRAPVAPGVFTSPTAGTIVDANASVAWGAATDPDGDIITYRTELYTPAAGWHIIRDWAGGTNFDYNFTNEQATSSAKLRVTARDTFNATSPVRESDTFTIQHNVAPGAPTPTFPTGGQVLNRALAHQFTATFNDPNTGDYPTYHAVRYRVRDSGAAWTIVEATNTDKFHLFAANFFAAAKYEYQWQYKDSLGEPSVWSGSEFFEIGNAPAAPVIQHPANNGQIATVNDYIAWAAGDQDGFRVRKRTADGATELYLHEDLNKPSVRDHPLTFPVNNRQELLEVQIVKNMLWSSWSSVLGNVDYTEPAVIIPMLTPDPANAGILVTYAAPAPVGTEPTVNEVTIRVRKVGETDYITKAVLPGNSGSWLHRDPDPFVEYEYQIYAHADNNTSSTSPWTA